MALFASLDVLFVRAALLAGRARALVGRRWRTLAAARLCTAFWLRTTCRCHDLLLLFRDRIDPAFL